MIARRKIVLLILFGFALLRLALFNVNVAEWGDAYDFLRLGESLTQGTYPPDAKRLPVLPLLIAPGVRLMDPVIWTKIVLAIISLATLIFTIKLHRRLFPDASLDGEAGRAGLGETLAVGALFIFNPYWLYWSIRIVAEPLLAFWVVLAFYLYFGYTANHDSQSPIAKYRLPILLGLVAGLAAMTRYEGFLLFGAIGLGIALRGAASWRKVPAKIKTNLTPSLIYAAAFAFVVSPWFIRNQILFGKIFYSPYFSDTAGFVSGAVYRWQWLLYALFMFGFPTGFIFLIQGVREKLPEWLNYLPVVVFATTAMILFYVWHPEARFYLAISPILLPFVVRGFRRQPKFSAVTIIASAILIGCYIIGIWHLRLYFLGIGKLAKALALGGGLAASALTLWPSRPTLFKRNQLALLVALAVLSQIPVAGSLIINHRQLYSTAYRATHDPELTRAINAGVPVAYDDETGVTGWYLRRTGVYYNQNLEPAAQLQWLKENKIGYVIRTNESNEGSTLTIVTDPDFAGHFELRRDYKNQAWTTLFASRIYQFQP